MEAMETKVPGAWVFTPRQHADDRGVFLEWLKADVMRDVVGHSLDVVQANNSVSRRGVLRGIHFALVPPGQAKYVYCPRGALMDFVVDIRDGSPTFGVWDSVLLDETDRRAMYIAEGIGHAFVALTDDASLTYLVSAPYDPRREFSVSPLDRSLGIDWGIADPILSDRDRDAPHIEQARGLGQLPTWESCLEHYAALGTKVSAHAAGGA